VSSGARKTLIAVLSLPAIAVGSPDIVVNQNTLRSGTDTVVGTGTISVSGQSTLTLGGSSQPYYWDGGTQAGGQKSFWEIEQGSSILLSGDAELNNNEAIGAVAPGKIINADRFTVYGQGLLEFDAAFNADLGGSRGSGIAGPTNIHGGLSTIRLNDLTWRTHASQNLPSVWKHTGDRQSPGNYSVTHHGLIFFEEDDVGSHNSAGLNPTWEVRTSTQIYDGGINWGGDWTLDVASGINLISDTTYEQELGPHVGFGDSRSVQTGSTVTKSGEGGLILARGAIQHYAPGSVMAVNEGSVEFNSNPTQNPATNGNFGVTFYATSASGQHLALTVADGASVEFRSYTWPFSENWWVSEEEGSSTPHGNDSQHQIWSLESSGKVEIGGLSDYVPRGVDLDTPLTIQETALANSAYLEIAEGFILTSSSTLSLHLGADDIAKEFKISIGGVFAQNGILEILDQGLIPGTYDLFDANSFSGNFSVILPQGYSGSYNSLTGELSLSAIPEPTSIVLVLTAAALVILLRRKRTATNSTTTS